MRDGFKTYESFGKKLSDCHIYDQKRLRTASVRRQPLDYGHAKASVLTDSDKFRIHNFYPVIDQLLVSLNEKIDAYSKVEGLFGFFRKLADLTEAEIKCHAAKVVNFYEEDLEEDLFTELILF